MSFFKEFKAFAMRGSVVDLAIGVVIGAAFGKVVNSFVSDILMPPIGALLGGVDFSNLSLTVYPASGSNPAVVIAYGSFVNTAIDFTIIAFSIFLVIKAMNKILPPAPVEIKTKDCPECLMSVPVKAKKCGHCLSNL